MNLRVPPRHRLSLDLVAEAWRGAPLWLAGGCLILAAGMPELRAHESRPAYLGINEITPHRYQLLWRTPLLSGQRLPVSLKLPAGVRTLTPPTQRILSDSVVEQSLAEAADGLAGKRIEFVGLEGTLADVLVRVQILDGGCSTTLVHGSQPWMEFEPPAGFWSLAAAYLAHGIEHILLGFDHLLFVLALLLIAGNFRTLVATVTAFTAAHSITLGLATLGIVQMPGPPVECCIALSILLLAAEILRSRRVGPGLATRRLWTVAFAFGLLHGFGFAGALRQIGLPPGDIPMALFGFNLGVEVGQLAFIAAVYGVIFAARRLASSRIRQHRLRPAVAYAIGTLAAFWFFDRLAGFWA